VLERINFQELQRTQEDTRKILGVPALSLRPFTKGYLMENLPDPHCQSETSNAISLAFLMVFVVIFPCITIIRRKGVTCPASDAEMFGFP